jgi:hypothetical protein
LAEPILYRNITCLARDTRQIKHLLVTLLQRDDLTGIVRSVTIPNEQRPHPAFTRGYDCTALVPLHDAINRAIKTAMASSFTKAYALKWFTNITGRRSTHGGALALILCMTRSIERLKIDEGLERTLPFIRKVMDLPKTKHQNMSQLSAFDKLTEFSVDDGKQSGLESIHLVPSLQKLRVCGSFTSQFTVSSPPLALSTLRLDSIHLMKPAFESAITSGMLRSVRELRMNCVHTLDVIDNAYDSSYLYVGEVVAMLGKHLPNLEVLECVHVLSLLTRGETPLDAFKDFKHLEELRVDSDFVFPTGAKNWVEASPIPPLFPGTLQRLEVVEMQCKDIDKLCEVDAATGINRLLEASSLKNLVFEVSMESWYVGLNACTVLFGTNAGWDCWELKESSVQYLEIVANELSKVGIQFDVY